MELSFPHHNRTPAPQVEFELRHTKEHLEKLKFNWLELHTKAHFLDSLVDGGQWQRTWTPAEIKQVERSIEPAKTTLKLSKGTTVDLESSLQQECEQLVSMEESIRDRHHHMQSLIDAIRQNQHEIDQLLNEMPTNGDVCVRGVEELQVLLDEQSIAMEKRASGLERQRNAVADLERLLALHEGEGTRLEQQVSELEQRKALIDSKNGVEERCLQDLCKWYGSMMEVLSALSGVTSVEMVRGDYLVAMVGGKVPVHLTVDPMSGRLMQAKVGATSATPKRQWKDIVDAAIEYNDIPFLLRSLSSIIVSSPSPTVLP